MKILIAEDHVLNADAMEFAIKDTMPCEAIKKVSNGSELLNEWEQFAPHLIILDIGLPLIDGIEAAKQIREKNKEVVILAISMHKDRDTIKHILKAGANGFFYKASDFQKFVGAVDAVMNGNKYIDDSVLDVLIDTEDEKTLLTTQEMRVLELLVEGETSEEIAEELCISLATVKFHRANILQKTRKKNIAQLVRWATLNNII